MKKLETDFAARLASGEADTCLCWRFERRDGVVVNATDHDQIVMVNGEAYSPNAALEAATFTSTADLSPGQVSGAGELSLDGLAVNDLEAGLWNRARVTVRRVDWRQPHHHILIWTGYLSRVSRTGDAFQAELVSLKADLEKPIGRVYGRDCDAKLGDERCKVDLDLPDFRAHLVVLDVPSDKAIRFQAGQLYSDDWFTYGVVRKDGFSWNVVAHAGNTLTFDAPVLLEPGDRFEVTAGCDKRFATCKAKFSNTDNFRGFPHLPGMDAILTGPTSGSHNDGGKR